MAPKQNKKRTQDAAKVATTPAAKKPKVDPMVAAVIEAIEGAKDMSESCRQMLLAFIPGSLAIPSDKRHDMQNETVAMLQEAMQSIQAALKAELDDQTSKTAGVEASKSDLDAKVVADDAVLSEKKGTVQASKEKLTAEEAAVQEAKKNLAAKQEEQRTGDAAAVDAQKDKTAVDNSIEVDLKAILSGEIEEKTAEAHYKALMPIIKTLSLDDSLLTALPAACTRQGAERGAFDKMVLDQLDKSFKDKAAALAKLLEEAAPASEARAAAVRDAEAALEASQGKAKEAAEQLAAAQAAEKEAAATLSASKAAVQAYLPEYSKVTEAKTACAAALEHFLQYNMSCFETLRDKVTKPEEPEKPAETEVAASPAKVAASPAKQAMEVEAVGEAQVAAGGC